MLEFSDVYHHIKSEGNGYKKVWMLEFSDVYHHIRSEGNGYKKVWMLEFSDVYHHIRSEGNGYKKVWTPVSMKGSWKGDDCKVGKNSVHKTSKCMLTVTLAPHRRAGPSIPSTPTPLNRPQHTLHPHTVEQAPVYPPPPHRWADPSIPSTPTLLSRPQYTLHPYTVEQAPVYPPPPHRWADLSRPQYTLHPHTVEQAPVYPPPPHHWADPSIPSRCYTAQCSLSSAPLINFYTHALQSMEATRQQLLQQDNSYCNKTTVIATRQQLLQVKSILLFDSTLCNLWERYLTRSIITSQTQCSSDHRYPVSRCLCVESWCWVGWFKLELTNEIVFNIRTKACEMM